MASDELVITLGMYLYICQVPRTSRLVLVSYLNGFMLMKSLGFIHYFFIKKKKEINMKVKHFQGAYAITGDHRCLTASHHVCCLNCC